VKIEFSNSAKKFFQKAKRSDQLKIAKKIEILKEDPLVGKKLKGEFEGKRSFKAWPFRIIYQVEKDITYILAIEHRQQVYK